MSDGSEDATHLKLESCRMEFYNAKLPGNICSPKLWAPQNCASTSTDVCRTLAKRLLSALISILETLLMLSVSFYVNSSRAVSRGLEDLKAICREPSLCPKDMQISSVVLDGCCWHIVSGV